MGLLWQLLNSHFPLIYINMCALHFHLFLSLLIWLLGSSCHWEMFTSILNLGPEEGYCDCFFPSQCLGHGPEPHRPFCYHLLLLSQEVACWGVPSPVSECYRTLQHPVKKKLCQDVVQRLPVFIVFRGTHTWSSVNSKCPHWKETWLNSLGEGLSTGGTREKQSHFFQSEREAFPIQMWNQMPAVVFFIHKDINKMRRDVFLELVTDSIFLWELFSKQMV